MLLKFKGKLYFWLIIFNICILLIIYELKMMIIIGYFILEEKKKQDEILDWELDL